MLGHQQKVNGHIVVINASSVDGKSFTEKELRDIEQYLSERGFYGNVDIFRVDFFERIRARIFGRGNNGQ